MPRKNAFTLVELLVVIAIMGVLLGIMLPALSKAREQARTIKCKTNLKGYGAAFLFYLEDNESCFPHSFKWLYDRKAYRDGGGLADNQYCRWHHELNNLTHFPQDAGQLWKYFSDKDNHLCPTFDKLAVSGLGQKHTYHNPGIPIEPQYTYSMNGHLGPRERNPGDPFEEFFNDNRERDLSYNFAVVNKLDLIEQAPSRVLSFTEENIMWNIQNRSCLTAVLGNNNIFGRLGGISYTYRSKKGNRYLPANYNGAFATYHMAPSQDIEIRTLTENFSSKAPKVRIVSNYATQNGGNYPDWDLCRGGGNAVFLDQHVEMFPYWVDIWDYIWPLKNKITRPIDWWPTPIR